MRIGIDLGGTKTEVIALSDQGAQLFRHRLPTPGGDYRQTIETVASLVEMAEQATGQSGTVGIGIPGRFRPIPAWSKTLTQPGSTVSRLIKTLASVCNGKCVWPTMPTASRCRKRSTGAAAGAQTVFAVIIGTGCGSGVALNGRAHIGGNGTAGEWGHNPLPWMDEDELRYRAEVPCYCGKQGCIETFISGTGFATDYRRLSGHSLKGSEIMQRVGERDPVAELGAEPL